MATSHVIAPPPASPSSDLPMDSRDLARRELGSRLYQALQDREWNQSDLARAADLPRELISTYVTGKAFPSPKSLIKIVRALGYNRPEDFLPVVTGVQSREENAPLDIRTWAGNPGMAWLKVNQAVPIAIAGEVMALLTSARRQEMEAALSGKPSR